jgi:hypothetical protein
MHSPEQTSTNLEVWRASFWEHVLVEEEPADFYVYEGAKRASP